MTRKEIQKNSLTLFKIPNNRNGRALLRRMREHAEPGVRIRARGRGPHGKMEGFTPHIHANAFGVYISKTALAEKQNRMRQRLYNALHAQDRLDSELFETQRALSVAVNSMKPLHPVGSWAAVWAAFRSFVNFQIWRFKS